MLISSAAKARFALWALRAFLPSEAGVKRRLNTGLVGLAAAVAGGVLAASAVVALVGGSIYALYAHSTMPLWQILGLMILLVMAIVIALVAFGISQLKQSFSLLNGPGPGPNLPPSKPLLPPPGRAFSEPAWLEWLTTRNPVHAAVDGFIAGLLHKKS